MTPALSLGEAVGLAVRDLAPALALLGARQATPEQVHEARRRYRRALERLRDRTVRSYVGRRFGGARELAVLLGRVEAVLFGKAPTVATRGRSSGPPRRLASP
jgi:hypothetical protein